MSGISNQSNGSFNSCSGDSQILDGDYNLVSGRGNNLNALALNSNVSGLNNNLTTGYSQISGSGNTLNGNGYSSVSGLNNNSSSAYSLISGQNQTGAASHCIISGEGHSVNGIYCSVSGQANFVNAPHTIVSGSGNSINSSGLHSVALGKNHFINGASSICLGEGNIAQGNNSLALGTSANAANDGVFVFSDTSSASGYSSSDANTFNIRASGGLNLDSINSNCKIDLKVDGVSKSTIQAPFSGNDTLVLSTSQNIRLFPKFGDVLVSSDIIQNPTKNLTTNNITCNSINTLTPQGGLYSGTADSVQIINGLKSMLPTDGIGTLILPANTIQEGDCFHIVCAGNVPAGTNDNVTVTLRLGGVQLANIVLEMKTSDPANFELEGDIQFRTKTGNNIDVITNIDFTYNQRIEKDFKGSRMVMESIVDTGLPLNFTLDGQFVDNSSSMITKLLYIGKTY
jgi:hypothetical protein